MVQGCRLFVHGLPCISSFESNIPSSVCFVVAVILMLAHCSVCQHVREIMMFVHCSRTVDIPQILNKVTLVRFLVLVYGQYLKTLLLEGRACRVVQ